MAYNRKIKDRFIELRAEGIPIQKAAEELHINRNTLTKWEKDLKSQIADLQTIKHRELQQKYFMSNEKRIELFGERLLAIKEELAKRDLSDIPTLKLLDMQIKYSNVLQTEFISPEEKAPQENVRINLKWADSIPCKKKNTDEERNE